MDRRPRASPRRAARRWAARARSTATSTIAASGSTSTAGRSAAIAAGAIPTCCPTSGAASSAWRGDADDDLPRPARATCRSPTSTGAIPCARPSSRARCSMGIPRNRDYNGTMQAGVSYVQRIIQNGRRVSAARGYLHPAMKRPNLTVRTHAQATSIVLEGKRAVGVRYRKGGRNGTPMEVRARQGSDPVRRHGELAAAAAGLGHRPGAAAEVARHRGEARAARRRREPARPLRAALRRPREERQEHQRALARACGWSARC